MLQIQLQEVSSQIGIRRRRLQSPLKHMAEGVGFEPTVAFTTPVFKTGLFDHSSTPPNTMMTKKRLALGF